MATESRTSSTYEAMTRCDVERAIASLSDRAIGPTIAPDASSVASRRVAFGGAVAPAVGIAAIVVEKSAGMVSTAA